VTHITPFIRNMPDRGRDRRSGQHSRLRNQITPSRPRYATLAQHVPGRLITVSWLSDRMTLPSGIWPSPAGWGSVRGPVSISRADRVPGHDYYAYTRTRSTRCAVLRLCCSPVVPASARELSRPQVRSTRVCRACAAVSTRDARTPTSGVSAEVRP